MKSEPTERGAAPLYIGLMSGTSLDGVDAVLMQFPPCAADWRSLAHAHRPFNTELRSTLLALNTSGADELHRAALAAQALVRAYAEVVRDVLQSAGLAPAQVRAIGAHGQTVRHRPDLGYTLQLNAPALLAELTGIDVVADFRSRDVAAGGQGAPLVPAFHAAAFGRDDAPVVVLNIGGMANLSVLRPGRVPVGFDCGPGNALLDGWCEEHTGEAFDRDGAWGSQGQVLESALALALADPYFSLAPPKSTGRDDFNAAWVAQWVNRAQLQDARPQDVQATLCALTALSAAQAIAAHAPDARRVLVCGGGALNADLMRRLQKSLQNSLQAAPGGAPFSVMPTDAAGLPVMQVEAAAFAWLAQCTVERRAGNVPEVTGAKGARVLGALYPAS